MNKVKVLSIVSIILLLTNLILVAFVLLRTPETAKHEGPRDTIIEQLHFSEAQITSYDSLIKGHRASIKVSQQKIMSLKNQLYRTLLKGNNPMVKDSVIGEINQVQEQIENIHYNHFVDIQRLCTMEQVADFEKLTKDIAALFAPSPPKGRK